jgi:hypothetical protein
MPLLRNVAWPRIIAESAIIVASVLLAFWLESWWNDREAAVEERAILVQLRAEIVAIAEMSVIQRTRSDAIRDSSTSLSNLALQEGGLEIGDDELYRLFADFLYHVDAKFTTAPVLESLFYTGDLDLISSSELRRDIAEVRIHLSNLRTEIDRESEYFNKTVIPYLQQNADIAQFYTNETFEPGYWGDPEFSYTYPGLMQGTTNPPVELLESREFLNIVLHRLTTLNNALFEWQNAELEEQLARIILLIDQELGDR